MGILSDLLGDEMAEIASNIDGKCNKLLNDSLVEVIEKNKKLSCF